MSNDSLLGVICKATGYAGEYLLLTKDYGLYRWKKALHFFSKCDILNKIMQFYAHLRHYCGKQEMHKCQRKTITMISCR